MYNLSCEEVSENKAKITISSQSAFRFQEQKEIMAILRTLAVERFGITASHLDPFFSFLRSQENNPIHVKLTIGIIAQSAYTPEICWETNEKSE